MGCDPKPELWNEEKLPCHASAVPKQNMRMTASPPGGIQTVEWYSSIRLNLQPQQGLPLIGTVPSLLKHGLQILDKSRLFVSEVDHAESFATPVHPGSETDLR